MEILKVENLKKVYGKGENIVNAVDNISFSKYESLIQHEFAYTRIPKVFNDNLSVRRI